ncbi:MAG: helix-turn-helix domain-containing protein [Ruminococcaceae bacterium]|nr:helix-turn-helix domain-containing protein [Oscillospiraceae bacterium]
MSFTRTQIESDLQCKMELVGRLEVEKGYPGTGLHKHHFFEIFYVSKGKFDVYFEDTSENISRGDLFIISPNVKHCFSSADGGEIIYVGVSLSDSVKMKYENFLKPCSADISETMERISYFASKKGAEALRRSLPELLPKLSSLILSLKSTGKVYAEDTLLEKVKEYVKLHYNENVTIRDIAGALYMNPHYLGEYFKKHSGTSVKDYLLTLRMQKAFALLKEGNMTVSQIAEAVGFDTIQYFSTKFKSYYGISPAKYLEKLKGNDV